MDIYSTRAQLAALEVMPPEYTFLYDTFGADAGVVEDDKAIYDYAKGTRKMAPVVHSGTGGVLMERTGYETREIGFCTIAPERIIRVEDVQKRYFGEQILGAMTPEERAKKMQVKDLMEMRAAIQRRREHMVRQVLLTGTLSMFRYTNEGRDIATTLMADYRFTNKFTPTNAWNTPAATIDADMQAMYDLVFEGLGTVDVMVMAPDVANILLANEKYAKLFDMRNVDAGAINTKYRGQGVRFLGHNADGVEMYSFAGKYMDDDNTMKPILPSGTVVMGAKGALKVVHGPVTQVEESGANSEIKTYIKKEVPLKYGSVESNSVKNRLTSRPTVVPFNVDAWTVAKVL